MAGATASGTRIHRPLYKVIYDERFHDSLRFGDEAKALGVATHAIQGDITDLWFKDLDLRWRQDKATVAGLTTESALFCLEQLAWDRRMRVVYRAEHEFLASESSLVDWAPRVALLVTSISPDRPRVARSVVTTSVPEPGHSDLQLLVSWIIAGEPQ
jgi:hypothetical protein